MSDSGNNRTINAIVRGIFLGGALGVAASWLTDYPLGRALGFGMLCGVAASLTVKDRMDSRKSNKGEAKNNE